MTDTIHALARAEWPYPDVLVRLALALALGLFIGLERERRGKEAGLRTFGFISLLGALGGALGQPFALLSIALTGMLTVFLNLQTMRADQGTELTTSAAMLVTCTVGVLCGLGHRLTPAAAMVITTALLAWKESLAGFSMGLSDRELRSALLLAILAIVIYPALPEGAVGPRGLIEPRAAWLTVILIAGIGFVNYVLWKAYGSRGGEIAGFLGGLVNSSVTVNEIAGRVLEAPGRPVEFAYRGILLATAAMVIRNAVLLAILAPTAFTASIGPHVFMLAATAAFLLPGWRTALPANAPEDAAPGQLELPFSFWVAVKYGLLFLALHIAGVGAQHFAGHWGFYATSVLGGLISSASAVAAAASLATSGALSPQAAGTGAVLASLTSVLVNLPFVVKAHHAALTRRLALALIAVAAAGAAGAAAWRPLASLLAAPG